MAPQVIETPTGGWLHEAEDYDWLYSHRTPMMRHSLSELPEEVDFGEWVIIEDQGSQGSCQGHSLSSCVEVCHTEAGGDYTQLSRAQAYYESQRLDGIRGDSGSTITGGCRLATEHGLVTERDWPYPSRYNPARPAGYESMTRYKISGFDAIKDFDDLIAVLLSRKAVNIGISWGRAMDRHNDGGVVTSFSPGGGGHAIALMGARVKDFAGNTLGYPHPVLYNSWSRRWGRAGRCLLSRQAVEQMLSHRWTVMMVLHGAPTPKPVEIDYV